VNDLNSVSVLFVCMGNICRSPTAEGVFRHLVRTKGLENVIKVDSAGTHAYHIGEAPDSRSQSTAKARGVDLSTQRARKFQRNDFESFDYVIAMDNSNYEALKTQATLEQQKQLYLFMGFTDKWDDEEVPDPYYGSGDGFTKVFDMVQAASEGLLKKIEKNDL